VRYMSYAAAPAQHIHYRVHVVSKIREISVCTFVYILIFPFVQTERILPFFWFCMVNLEIFKPDTGSGCIAMADGNTALCPLCPLPSKQPSFNLVAENGLMHEQT
jgi:hypothetical protein